MLTLAQAEAVGPGVGQLIEQHGFPITFSVALIWVLFRLGKEALAIANRLAEVHIGFVETMKTSIRSLDGKQDEMLDRLRNLEASNGTLLDELKKHR